MGRVGEKKMSAQEEDLDNIFSYLMRNNIKSVSHKTSWKNRDYLLTIDVEEI